MLMPCQTERPATLWHHLLIMRQDCRNALRMNQTMLLLRAASRLSECFGIGLSVHAFFFGGSDVCEWIYLFIDVCVLCLSHSSGLVWPVCKHVCKWAATSLQEWVGNRNAARGGSLPSDAEANGTSRLEQSLRVLLMISQYNGMWLFFFLFWRVEPQPPFNCSLCIIWSN